MDKLLCFVCSWADNDDANSNNIISTIRDTTSMLSLYQQKTTKSYQHFLAKGLKDQCIRVNIKQKVRIKTQQRSIDILWNQTL